MSQPRKIARGLSIVAIVLILSTCIIWSFQSRVGTSATAEEAAVGGLPPDANDVRWFLPGAFGPNMVYDFATTPQGFRRWVSERNRPKLTGPRVGPFRILVYDHANSTFAFYEITDAIAYTWSEEDRGVHMVYDRDMGRAYYHSHSR